MATIKRNMLDSFIQSPRWEQVQFACSQYFRDVRNNKIVKVSHDAATDELDPLEVLRVLVHIRPNRSTKKGTMDLFA